MKAYVKTIAALCLCLYLGVQARAQEPVEYHNYINCEKELLQALKDGGFLSTFTSMRALQRQAAAVQESAPTRAHLLKAGKKKMDGEKLVKERTPSVLMMCKYSPTLQRPEEVTVGATAFVLSQDGVCVTNYHVLQPVISQKSKLRAADSITFAATKDGKVYAITEILAYNKAGDIAIFKIDPRGDKLKPVPIGYDLGQGAPIQALTHPIWHLYYYSKGVVARTVCSDSNDPFTRRTETTADYAKGSSGGPLFDKYGNLAAMVSTTQSIYYVEQPQTSLQMVVKSVIPVSSILRLVEDK